jgi:hypothetical protein
MKRRIGVCGYMFSAKDNEASAAAHKFRHTLGF